MKQSAKRFAQKNNMLRMKTFFVFLFWGLIVVTTILLLIEVKPSPQTWPKDKLQHALTFALITYFGIKSYPKYVLYVCLGLAIYGGFMEAAQSLLTQTRNASIGDWLADVVGIALGFLALNLCKNLGARPT
jgi:VanZ family protein